MKPKNEAIKDSEIQKILESYKKGNLEKSITDARTLCERHPHNPTAWNLLGSALLKSGKIDEAAQAFEVIIEKWPEIHVAYIKMGVIKNKMKDYQAAEKFLRFSEKDDPQNTDILYNISVALSGQEKYEAAIEYYRKLLRKSPHHANAMNNLGVILQKLNRHEDSVEEFLRALESEPSHLAAHKNISASFRSLGNTQDAIKHLKLGISINPHDASLHTDLGLTYLDLEDYEEAIECFNKALEQDANSFTALIGKGKALQKQEKFENALTIYEDVIQKYPNDALIHNNIGTTLMALNRFQDAITYYKRAISINANFFEAYNNLGNAYRRTGEVREEKKCLEAALAINPGDDEIRFRLGLLNLQDGKLKTGFTYYEARHSISWLNLRQINPRKKWDNKKRLNGENFLIYAEQGLGDTIQFSRFLPDLQRSGANVTFSVQSNIHHLLKNLNIKLVAAEHNMSDNLFEFSATLMSLPHLLDIRDGYLDNCTPYLSVDDCNIERWSKRLTSEKFKIAICWQGSNGKIDKDRSFHLSNFKSISSLPDVELISVHKGSGEYQLDEIDFPVKVFQDDMDSGPNAFQDTASIIMNCDLVITSDTSIAHLAGALGRPTWVILKFNPDWRWMQNRITSPWYKSMLLFRQKERGNWASAFIEAENRLRQLL